MLRKMNSKKIMADLRKDMANLIKKKEVHRDKIEKMVFTCYAMRFVKQGEKLWRENKFAEADAKFRQGWEHIQENLHFFEKNKDRVEYSAAELFKYDLKCLSEVVLFDREFQSIFQSNNFSDLKSRINFLSEFARKNLSKEFTDHRLQSVLVIKMKYFVMLTEAMLFESFKSVYDRSDINKSLPIFKRLGFKKAEEALKKIDSFLFTLKEKIHKYGGLVSIPLQEESSLMEILQRGASKEKEEYEVLRTGKKSKGMTKDDMELLEIKDYDLYFNVCTNEIFITKEEKIKKVELDKKPKEILIFFIENAGKMYDWLDLREKFFPDKKLPDGREKPYGPDPIHKQISILTNAIQGKNAIFIKRSKNVPLKEGKLAYYFNPKASYCLIKYTVL